MFPPHANIVEDSGVFIATKQVLFLSLHQNVHVHIAMELAASIVDSLVGLV
jgi:hypothetical protein